MSVYVTALTSCLPTRRRQWTRVCYLFADKEAELHAFAIKIGLPHTWCQHTIPPYYELTQEKQKLALKHGASITENKTIPVRIAEQAGRKRKREKEK